jgi:hypothetical protein
MAADGVRGGPEAGPREFLGEKVAPFGSAAKALVFKSGEVTRVVMAGSPQADADLYVFDADGNLVAWDDSPLGAGAAEWLPQRTASYTVEIRNSAPAADTVDLFIR